MNMRTKIAKNIARPVIELYVLMELKATDKVIDEKLSSVKFTIFYLMFYIISPE